MMRTDLITMSEAAAAVRINRATVWRWAKQGVVVGKKTVRLRFLRVGGRVFTTLDWMAQFCDNCTAKDKSDIATPDGGERSHAEADAHLSQEGL